mmetsp:Transcript_14806/g.14397  ORF Transcript_14806/g.14397 Transcript_14806/m.14397 type:complete len:97 (-) Transcript_14806:1791-2081(-)
MRYKDNQKKKCTCKSLFTEKFSFSDPLILKWESFIIVLAIFNAFTIPVEIAFMPEIMETALFICINSLIDLFFLIDIFVNFRMSYFDHVLSEEIKD